MCYNQFLSIILILKFLEIWSLVAPFKMISVSFNMFSSFMMHLLLTGIRKCPSLTGIFPVPAWIKKKKEREAIRNKEDQKVIFLKVFPIKRQTLA